MPEIWRDVVGYEGYYRISESGLIDSCDRVIDRADRSDGVNRGNRVRLKGGPMRLTKDEDGYLVVRLAKDNVQKKYRVHRLVLEAFVGPPDTPDLVGNHVDTDIRNNHYKNLEWCTAKENSTHAAQNGLYKPEHFATKLTWDSVRQIRAKYAAGGTSLDKLAKEYGVTKRMISVIYRNLAWKE